MLLEAATDTLPSDWSPRGLGGGGGMFSPTISPHDPNIMFIAVDMGHVLRSLDGGSTWQIVSFKSLQGQHHTQIQFTSTAQILYAAERGRDPITEGNLFRPRKSLNLGDDWVGFSSWPPSGYPNERAVSVWADPDRDDSLLVASDARLWYYRDAGTADTFTLLGAFPSGNARVAGVYWSGTSEEVWIGTSDGMYYHADPDAGGLVSTVTSPTAGNRIISFTGAFAAGVLRFYAVTTQLTVNATKSPQSFSGGVNNRVYRIDWLTDSSWTLESGIPAADYPIEAGMARNRIDCVHVSVARSASYPNQHSVYRQDGPGVAWVRTMITEANGNLTTGWGSINSNAGPVANTLETNISYSYPCGLAVSRTDADRVVICDNCVIHRCNNATQASPVWTQVYTTADNSNHAPGQLFPHGQSYRTNGLELTVCYWVDWSSSTDVFLGALDYLAPHSTDGGVRWGFDYDPTVFPSGDIPQVVTDSVTGYRYAICSYAVTLYEYLGVDDINVDYPGPSNKGGPGLWSLAPGASQWLPVRQDFGVGEPGSASIRGANPTWVVVDAARRRLYVAVSHSDSAIDGVYMQNLSTGVWHKLPSPSPGAFRPANTTILHPFNIRIMGNGDLLVSFAARQAGNSSAGYTPSSGVFVYSQANDTWTDKTTRVELRYATRDVVIDPHDPSELTWYACVTNTDLSLTSPVSTDAPHTYGGLYKTVDGGGTWALVWNGESGVAGKPGIPGQANVTGCSVNSVTVNPDKPYELWMTTRYCGLWISQDINSATPTFQQSAYPFRAPERVFFNPYVTDEVWVTSNGYGVNVAHRPKVFELWRKDHFPAESGNDLVAGPSADPDADGICNLLEYALAADPVLPSLSPKAAITTFPSQRLALVFDRIGDPSLVYAVYASSDLVDWGVSPIWSSTSLQNLNGQVTVSDVVDISAAPRRFLRLQVTKP